MKRQPFIQSQFNKQNQQNSSNDIKANDSKKNRISFKEFQQNYEEHMYVQKQKRKSQQQSLKQLTLNNQMVHSKSKEILKAQVVQAHQKSNGSSLTLCNSKKQLKQLSITELTSMNSSVAGPSCFVSPKASNGFMKSINLASNKSKQFSLNASKQKFVQSNKNTKVISKEINLSKKQPQIINLNCNIGQQSKQMKKIDIKKPSNHSIHDSRQKVMSKNNSLSKMKTDYFEGSLKSYPSSKMLTNQIQQQHQTNSDLQPLVNQLQFINQTFNQLYSEENDSVPSKKQRFGIKIKLLTQTKNKLLKEQQALETTICSSLKTNFYEKIITLLENYQSDLKHFITEEISQHPRQSNLQIKIDEQHEFDLDMRFKRPQSRKKTIKLSKSRRTNEETLHSESVSHQFDTEEFSLLNTSKITQISRPSSQNKEKSQFSNEIQSVIKAKLGQNGQKDNNKVKKEPQLVHKQKIHLKRPQKRSSQGFVNKYPNIPKQLTIWNNQAQDLSIAQKDKSVSKTISLFKASKPHIPDLLQPTYKQHNSHLPSETVYFKRPIQDEPSHMVSSGHNQSIYELEFLQNYSSLNRPSFSQIHLDSLNRFGQEGQFGTLNRPKDEEVYGSRLFR